MKSSFIYLFLVVGLLAGTFFGLRARAGREAPADGSLGPTKVQPLSGAAQLESVTVGHEFRQDDLPSVAAAPDGSVWVAWLSFAGDRDDLAIRRYENGNWSNLHWVPGTSGDNWLPQVAVDSANRVWVIWTQQLRGNWDIYSRRFDPGRQQWDATERLTSDPLPDVNPRVWSDGEGRAALVWQGFRGKNSNIFLRTLEGDHWSPEIRVTNRAANDWEPAVAMDSRGTAWVAYDSYKNGNYDVFLTPISGGRIQGEELAVAATPRFEARASVSVDTAGRVWVAWEAGQPNWGKDVGFILRGRKHGVQLGGFREPRIRCYVNREWREPEVPLAGVYRANTYQPRVFSDGRGSVWVVASMRRVGPQRPVYPPRPGYWEYYATHLDGNTWSEAVPLPNSKGRSSTTMNAALGRDASLWLAWPTDNRDASHYHRPRRQQVFAGRLSPTPTADLRLKLATDETVPVPANHAPEIEHLRAIRAYTATVDGKPTHILRGDLHRHTELSWDEGGAGDGSVDDFQRYMMDAGSLDFGAITDHQGGAWPYWWWLTQKVTDMYLVPGVYTSLFGYERSASFPFGHHNMIFGARSDAWVSPFYLKEGARVYRFPLSPEGDEPSDETGDLATNDTRLLYDDVRQHHGIAIPHTSAMRNFGTDWKDHDPAVEPVVEIFQGCRLNSEAVDAPYAFDPVKYPSFAKTYNPAGMVSNAWAKGYKLGIIASSDHGSTHISYAMVYTNDRSRQGILNAIRRRHTYGATDNIILDVRMGAHFMGDEFALSQPLPLRVKVRGTGPLAKVEVLKDSRVVHSVQPKSPVAAFEYTDQKLDSQRHYYYVRVQQQDGMVAWSSPVFVNYRQ